MGAWSFGLNDGLNYAGVANDPFAGTNSPQAYAAGITGQYGLQQTQAQIAGQLQIAAQQTAMQKAIAQIQAANAIRLSAAQGKIDISKIGASGEQQRLSDTNSINTRGLNDRQLTELTLGLQNSGAMALSAQNITMGRDADLVRMAKAGDISAQAALAAHGYSMEEGAQQANLQGQWALDRENAAGKWGYDTSNNVENLRGGYALQEGQQAEGFRQQRFQQVLPLFEQQMSAFQDSLKNFSAGGTGSFTGGSFTPPQTGASGNQPHISAAPVFTPGQIQGQVNAGWANANQQAQTQQHQAANQFAGRGFSSRSPALAALQGQFEQQAMQTGADTERQTRLGSAQANAGQVLSAQQAQEAQYASRQQEALGYAGINSQQGIAAMNANAQLQAAALDARARLASGFLGSGFFGSYLS